MYSIICITKSNVCFSTPCSKTFVHRSKIIKLGKGYYKIITFTFLSFKRTICNFGCISTYKVCTYA